MKRGGSRLAFFEAIATLTGTIIGAGVLGIPYVAAKSGFLTAALDLFILTAAVVILYLYVGEVVLRTKKQHQLTGYAEKYLGKWGKRLFMLTMIFGIYGALIAYMIGEGGALNAIFNGVFSNLTFSLIFFGIGASIIFIGLRAIKESELLMSNIVIGIIILICILAFSSVNFENLIKFELTEIFFPYGVILFALAGAVAIPEMKEELKDLRQLKRAIIIGAMIPPALYLFFALVVVGVTGINTTEVASIGLGNLMGEYMVIFGNLFAIFAMATSFLTLGLALKEMYNYDYGVNKHLAWLLTIVPPLVMFLLFKKGFVEVIGVTGGIAMGLEGILIALMFQKAKKMGDRKPEYSITGNRFISYGLVVIFALGIVYTIWSLV